MRILYHLPLSPAARKVRLVLNEKRLPFETKIERVWERRPEFLAMNPAATVPVLEEENGVVVPDSAVISHSSFAERIETRRLHAWFDGKFASEVTRNLAGEKHMKRLMGRGEPDAGALRAGYTNLKFHMDYIGWLAETRKWLAGSTLSIADFAAAAHLSVLDFIGDVDWSASPPAKEWYARVKSRPCFRAILADRVSGVPPPAHYADLDS